MSKEIKVGDWVQLEGSEKFELVKTVEEYEGRTLINTSSRDCASPELLNKKYLEHLDVKEAVEMLTCLYAEQGKQKFKEKLSEYISAYFAKQITQTEVKIKSGHMAGYGVEKPKVGAVMWRSR